MFGKYLESLSVVNVLLENNIKGSQIVYAESTHVAEENRTFIKNRFVSCINSEMMTYVMMTEIIIFHNLP